MDRMNVACPTSGVAHNKPTKNNFITVAGVGAFD
jgi:hypothetical protein